MTESIFYYNRVDSGDAHNPFFESTNFETNGYPSCVNESCVIQVDVQTLQQQSADSVPLLGGDKGPKDDRGEEEDEEVGEEPSSEGADR